MQNTSPLDDERGLAFIRFLSPQVGRDVVDAEQFLSDLHRVRATHVLCSGLTTAFLDARDRVVAVWPTAQIAFITWGSATAMTMALNEVEMAEEADPPVVDAGISGSNHPARPPDDASFDADELHDGDLSVRALNALRWLGVTTWSQLLQADLEEIANLPNVGTQTLRELEVALTLRSSAGSGEWRPQVPDHSRPDLPSTYCGIGEDDLLVPGLGLQARTPACTPSDRRDYMEATCDS